MIFCVFSSIAELISHTALIFVKTKQTTKIEDNINTTARSREDQWNVSLLFLLTLRNNFTLRLQSQSLSCIHLNPHEIIYFVLHPSLSHQDLRENNKDQSLLQK
jgi:hypothetical protein